MDSLPESVGKSVVIILLWSWCSVVWAEETGKIFRSADRLGKGNSGMTAPADEDALVFNPSRLWAGEGRGLRKWVFFSPGFVVSDKAFDLQDAAGDDAKMLTFFRDSVGDPVDIAVDNFFGVLAGNMGFGLIASASANILVYKDADRSGVEAVQLGMFQDSGVYAGSSCHIARWDLHLGMAFKVVRRNQTKADITIADVDAIKNFSLSDYQNKGTGFGADVAATWAPVAFLKPELSLVITDVGNTAFSNGSGNFSITPLRQSVNVGSSVYPPVPYGEMSVHADIHDVLNNEDSSRLKHLHFGLEYLLLGQIGLKGGVNQGYGTIGFSYRNRFFRFDVGSYAEEVGERVGERPSRRTYFRLMSTYVVDEPALPGSESKSSAGKSG